MTPYYCEACGKQCENEDHINIVDFVMQGVKCYYFCDDCAKNVLDLLSNMFNGRVQNSPSCERMTYQRFKEMRGE